MASSQVPVQYSDESETTVVSPPATVPSSNPPFRPKGRPTKPAEGVVVRPPVPAPKQAPKGTS